jgi:signal transduction histidine kinase
MTLGKRLALRYGAMFGICLLLLGGLVHHEFITEPRERQTPGAPELPETFWGEYAEVFFYGMLPVVIACGWWSVRRALAPLGMLTAGVERMHAGNLQEPLPRCHTGDEVDRLTEVFNSMAARLDQSFQQIRHFTLHASHELKTPLTIMRIQLETMLEEKSELSPKLIEWLECELDEVQRLTRIVESLNLLTKADAGLVKLERKPVALAELLRECFDDAQILAEPNEVRVTLEPCEEAVVLGERDRLRQLLLNLTDNAIKYNRPGGLVTIALRRREGLAELEITNTGEGIPATLQPRLFERFVRGDEARSRAIDGCGLGLAICRWIVQAHGGTILLSSTPGQPTAAVVRLPLAEHEDAKRESVITGNH